MTKKQKNALWRILISGAVFILFFILFHTGIVDTEAMFENAVYAKAFEFIIYLIPYVIIGGDIVKKAVVNIGHGQVFDENFLMCIATFGAFGTGEYDEAVAVMLFYQVGELFQSYAVNRSRKSITELMDICPEYANLEVGDSVEKTDPDEVSPGSMIVIKPGEKVPLDGVIVEGSSFVDTSALTGESVPRKVCEGEEIISGCVNGSGVLRVRVTKEFDDSTVAKILELVENASSRKAKVENFITKFAKYYTPVVVLAALLIALIPPIVLGGGFGNWIQRGCIFLVISCPCALVISVPLSFFGGIGAASKKGILVKGSNYLEMVSQMDTVVFDKTGTLTKGEFEVAEVFNENGMDALLLAALLEKYSEHPIAKSILSACDNSSKFVKSASPEYSSMEVSEVEEIAGYGIKGTAAGKTAYAGKKKLLTENGIDVPELTDAQKQSFAESTVVYVGYDGRYAGCIFISDQIKPGVEEALISLKKEGVKRFVMLTGDKKETGEAIAGRLGIDEAYTELLPEDKVSKVEELIETTEEGRYVAFAGDGINDAPVITRADIGIAMGSMGSDAAIEAADVVLMEDDISRLSSMIRISRKTMKIVRQNIVFALGVKLFVLILGAFGLANMWEAVFADVGVAVLAILNAMRANSSK
ncbi:MAG: heavy metal translocating P-type ATPase [Roseburia sp.]|nr:heavy metal translocating P-type ATPase [Roseburia sp.]